MICTEGVYPWQHGRLYIHTTNRTNPYIDPNKEKGKEATKHDPQTFRKNVNPFGRSVPRGPSVPDIHLKLDTCSVSKSSIRTARTWRRESEAKCSGTLDPPDRLAEETVYVSSTFPL